jgi:hypothetical protein
MYLSDLRAYLILIPLRTGRSPGSLCGLVGTYIERALNYKLYAGAEQLFSRVILKLIDYMIKYTCPFTILSAWFLFHNVA